ncbi:DUF882 domain-containing protein [Hoeflea poritis]|uniref:Murein endopeptidase K n=1 Tax=Hoeflea poritis TaxID=2993659 RepID=A0ABT4VQW8_9HYPH|nr:DUF882 domain-containing protein [Hoeflea poritis]MDA4847112.1 DUF882 domain-containing protein [Hoeflea poritis]
MSQSQKIAEAVNGRSRVLAVVLFAFVCVLIAAPAQAETRSLKLYFIHTKERATITYKKNGRYIPGGLKKLNRFLRDWRQKEATKMDPRLFDLLWEVYRASGSKDHIHVVSAYRSPKTNAMLRKRSRGVAKKSQHMAGKAIDFYIPDVPVKKLRRIGMQFQVGGVGYYPKSGSPFVHLDVGSVRSWPRMNRNELSRVFPKGKTLHLPSDGKPLPGYDQALADYKKRVKSNSIQVAGRRSIRAPSRNNNDNNSGGGGNLLAGLFGGGKDKDEPQQNGTRRTVVASAPTAASALPGVDAAEAALEPDLSIVPTPRLRPASPSEDGVQIALASAREELSPEAITAAFRPRLPENDLSVPAGNLPQEDNRPVVVALAPPRPPQDVPGGSFLGAGDNALPGTGLRAGGNTAVHTASLGVVPQSGDAIGSMLADPVMTGTASARISREELGLGQSTPLTNDSRVPQLAYVPLPGQRPEFGSPEAQAIAAVFENGVPARPSNETTAGIPVPRPSPFGSPRGDEMVALPPVQVALAPANGGLGNASGRIDAFAPQPEISSAKRGRPSARDAAQDRRGAIRGAPVLAPNTITHNALSSHRVATMDAPVRAPQFVSSHMRSAPDTVHVSGFSRENQVASADAFSGRAVNFMTVARFETRSQ